MYYPYAKNFNISVLHNTCYPERPRYFLQNILENYITRIIPKDHVIFSKIY